LLGVAHLHQSQLGLGGVHCVLDYKLPSRYNIVKRGALHVNLYTVGIYLSAGDWFQLVADVIHDDAHHGSFIGKLQL